MGAGRKERRDKRINSDTRFPPPPPLPPALILALAFIFCFLLRPSPCRAGSHVVGTGSPHRGLTTRGAGLGLAPRPPARSSYVKAAWTGGSGFVSARDKRSLTQDTLSPPAPFADIHVWFSLASEGSGHVTGPWSCLQSRSWRRGKHFPLASASFGPLGKKVQRPLGCLRLGLGPAASRFLVVL